MKIKSLLFCLRRDAADEYKITNVSELVIALLNYPAD